MTTSIIKPVTSDVFCARRMKNKKSFIIFISIYSVGLLLSIVLHEAFHCLMHWGHITGIEFFTHNNIVTVVAMIPRGYNVLCEELIAYSITGITMIIGVIVAVILVVRIRDKV